MLENYTLPRSALEAALTHAAKQDVRYCLNGVLLDFPNGRIVATDGHRMFVGAVERADEPAIIIPRDTVEDAVKAAKRIKYIASMYVNVSDDPNSATAPRRVELVTAGARFSAAAVDGQFPDYERVIPAATDEDEGKMGHYNPDYLVAARTALDLYGGYNHKRGGYFLLQRGPNKSAMMYGNFEALCVIMPLRADAPTSRPFTAQTEEAPVPAEEAVAA